MRLETGWPWSREFPAVIVRTALRDIITSAGLCGLWPFPARRTGVFSEYCTHAASMTFKLPDNVSTMEGGLMEPLAVGMHACELSNAKLGETAVVLELGVSALLPLCP